MRTMRMTSKEEFASSTISSTPSLKRKPAFPLSSYNLASDEKKQKNTFLSFIDYSTTPYSQVIRLVEQRAYARSDQFDKNMMDVPPTIDDVAPPPHGYGAVGQFLAWNKLPARAVVGTLAYFAFPFILECLSFFTRDVKSDALLSLLNSWLPGVSIVLGTYVSLTLSILYDRFSRMQETVYKEASLLALTCHTLLHLFEHDKEAAVEGTQCIADQIRILIRESRGREIMGVIYSDPYARILDLLNRKGKGPLNLDSQLLCEVRGQVQELFRTRSSRMADEALGLTTTHFDVMTFLSGLLLLGFALGATDIEQVDGGSDLITRILFSALIVCYVILYEMSFDLNIPFSGVYQIRRSGVAMHFLQVKHLISNHDLVSGLVDFEAVDFDEDDEALGQCEVDCQRSKEATWFN